MPSGLWRRKCKSYVRYKNCIKWTRLLPSEVSLGEAEAAIDARHALHLLIFIGDRNFSMVQGRRTRKICGYFVSYSHKINSLFSHRPHGSHGSHKAHLLTLVFAIRLQTLGRADKRGRSDAQFVRFVRSVWNSIICARLFWCVYPVLWFQQIFYSRSERFLSAVRNASIRG